MDFERTISGQGMLRGGLPRSVLATGLMAAALGNVAIALTGCATALDDLGSAGAPAAPAAEEFSQSADFAAPADSGGMWAEESADADSGLDGLGPDTLAASVTSERRLIFTGRIDALVDDLDKAVAETQALTEHEGGFVENMSRGGDNAFLRLRIPQAKLAGLRAFVRELAAEVRSDTLQREDVTSQRADTAARLENLRSAERELRELLAEQRELGGDTEDVLEVFRELSDLRGRIEGLEAQLESLDEQVAYSTLEVELRAVAGGAQIGDASWNPAITLRRAWSDFLGRARALADGLLYFVVAVLPFVVIWIAIVWLAGWAIRALWHALGLKPLLVRLPLVRRRRRGSDADQDRDPTGSGGQRHGSGGDADEDEPERPSE